MLHIGDIVIVKGKYDYKPYKCEIIELQDGLMFTYRNGYIISCAKYSDIIDKRRCKYEY